MKTLRELTRGIAKIVNGILGRVTDLEKDLSSQEHRIAQLEEVKQPSFHSMEVAQQELVDREEVRQDNLSDKELRQDLKSQYGTTGWAKKLINDIVNRRQRKKEPEL